MNYRMARSICLLLVFALTFTALCNGQLFEVFKVFEQSITRTLSSVDKPIGNILSDIPNLNNLNPAIIAECFVPELKGNKLNIFDPLTSFKVIVTMYYKAFPSKKVTPNSVNNLLDSSREMVTLCLNPLRPKGSAKYGFTILSDLSLKEFYKMFGLNMPPLNATNLGRNKRLSGDDERCLATESNIPEEFDWRSANVVTPVRFQGICESCWTFASLATVESALLIRNKTNIPVDKLDLSEQQLVQCARLGKGCQGGSSYLAYSYIHKYGVELEPELPYTAKNGFCPRERFPSNQSVHISNYCIRSLGAYTKGALKERLTELDIQKTLLQYGPLYMAINAVGLTRNYRGGIIDIPNCSTRVNHAIVLVGYTENSWIFKNSWGTEWGDNGFFEVVRDKNMCGVNSEIAWPLL